MISVLNFIDLKFPYFRG